MNSVSTASASNTAAETDPIRVMIVDDSVVIRGLLGRWVDSEPSLAVVASHRNGQQAVDDIERSNPDVVLLDIEMPVMDGMTALPLMLKKKKNLIVIMASTLTRRNAEISLRALSLGAHDYVPKPESTSGVTTSVDFRRELIDRCKNLGLVAKKSRVTARPARPMRAEIAKRPASGKPGSLGNVVSARPTTPTAPRAAKPTFTLRQYSNVRPRVLAIGSSTGGPQALQQLMRNIGSSIREVPVVVTQHMPPTFTSILAEHLAKAALCDAKEAEHNEALKPGTIYVAPGGKHMTIAKSGQGVVAMLNDDPPVNFCKPAVDPLFESVAAAFGPATLSLVLTGMGADGAEGVRKIAQSGGSVIAQDEATSVVWGMPGAAAHTGQCSDVLPLAEIGPKVTRLLSGSVR
ncbi:MAG: chemotaxis response regulator protein-glutamate methylesterase [Stappiaceae bacterium]